MFTVSDRMRELRYHILSQDPTDYQSADLNKFGQELNEFRTILARLANVHNGTGKIAGWGHLEGTVPASWFARQAAQIEEPEADESDPEIPETGTKSRRSSSRPAAS